MKKKSITPIEDHKLWLTEVANHYGVSEENIINGDKEMNSIVARQTFYWLCWRDKINVARLSEHIGKHRTTIACTMNQGWKHRQRDVENKIYEKITLKKALIKKEEEDKRRQRGFCNNVAITGRLVFTTSSKR